MNHDMVMGYLNHPRILPERAYCLLPSDPTQVIVVVKNEKGYYPFKKYDTELEAKKAIYYYNDKFGVNREAAEALMILSMRSE